MPASKDSPLVVKVHGKQTWALKCEHCAVTAKWGKTYKLVNCDMPGHPVGIRRANDHGVWGCWLCGACAASYPVAASAEKTPRLSQDESLF